MICYKDRTFCRFYLLCKDGHGCERALTPKVQEEAEAWWGGTGAPICVYSEFPKCFIRWFEPTNIRE